MGFLERIINVNKTNNKVSTNKTQKRYFWPSFSANALKRTNLKNDVFESSAAVEQKGLSPRVYTPESTISKGIIFEEELALRQPEKFISLYVNPMVIEEAIMRNPNIVKILRENNLPLDYNIDNVTSIVNSHLLPTARQAQKIYKNLGHSEKEKKYTHLTQAALLHDIGKAFIPSEILNKTGRLSSKERQIVELHNRLSYEILKTTRLHPNVAKYALEHHDYEKNIERSDENQSLTVADIYCALKEDRPYKKPLNEIATRTILYDMGTNGKFDVKYINYLK